MKRLRSGVEFTLRSGDPIEGWTAGAVGLTWHDRDGRGLFVTCAHVVAGPDADATGDPVWTPSGVEVGRVVTLTPVHTHRFDAALVEATVPIEPLVSGDPPVPVVGYEEILTGSRDRFLYTARGETVTCSGPELVEEPIAVHLGGTIAHFRGCVQLAVVSGLPVPGHSGALLVREAADGVIALGIVFAGDARHVLVNQLTAVLEVLRAPRPLFLRDTGF